MTPRVSSGVAVRGTCARHSAPLLPVPPVVDGAVQGVLEARGDGWAELSLGFWECPGMVVRDRRLAGGGVPGSPSDEEALLCEASWVFEVRAE